MRVPYWTFQKKPHGGICTDCKLESKTCFCSDFCLRLFCAGFTARVYIRENLTVTCRPKYASERPSGQSVRAQLNKPNKTDYLPWLGLASCFDSNGRVIYYNVLGVRFDGGRYSARRINPVAWKAFNMPWRRYVTQMVRPLCSEADKVLIDKIVEEAPVTNRNGLFRILGAKTSKTKVVRLYYLLFSVVYNCVQLGLRFPANVCVLPNDYDYTVQFRYFDQNPPAPKPLKRMDTCTPRKQRQEMSTPRKQRQEVSSGSGSGCGSGSGSGSSSCTSREKRKEVSTPREKRCEARNGPAHEVSYNDMMLKQQAKKQRERDRERDRCRKRELDNETYIRWCDRETESWRSKRHFVRQHSQCWNPNIDKLIHIPELGMSGTMTDPSQDEVNRYFKEIHIANGRPKVTVGDAGASCLNQMRCNRMIFPDSACYGFEMQNQKQYAMHDTLAIEESILELDKLLSVYEKKTITTEPFCCAWNVMYSDESSKLSLPKFLSTPCRHPACNRNEDLYNIPRRKGDGTHFCNTCGFNEREQTAFFSKSRLHYYTWFSKSWADDDKLRHLEKLAPTSSTIDVLFMADEACDHNSGKILRILNKNIRNPQSAWHLARRNFSVKLRGGGQVFSGFIYARNSVITNIDKVKEKIASLENAENTENAENENKLFNNLPDFTLSPCLQILCRLRIPDTKIAERAIQYAMVVRGSWDYVGLPDPGSMSTWLNQLEHYTNQSLTDIIVDCIKQYGKSFRAGYRYKERGVHNNARNKNGMDIERLRKTIDGILNYAEEGGVVWSETDMLCSSCGLTGDPAVLCGHLKSNYVCQWSDVFWAEEGTVDELKRGFQQNVLNAIGILDGEAVGGDREPAASIQPGDSPGADEQPPFVQSIRRHIAATRPGGVRAGRTAGATSSGALNRDCGAGRAPPGSIVPPPSGPPRMLQKQALTPDEQQLAHDLTAVPGNNMDEVIVSAFNIKMTRSLLSCLGGQRWLGDEVINFYLQLLTEREEKRMERTRTPREVFFVNSFFFAKLLVGQESYQYENICAWTTKKKVDIFSLERMVIPIHTPGHWSLAVIDFQHKAITYYDSLGSGGGKVLDTLHKYIQDEHEKKKNAPLPNLEKWSKVSTERAVPQQRNGSDCGVFTAQFANYISQERELDFSQDDIPYFRNRMSVEIARKRLFQDGGNHSTAPMHHRAHVDRVPLENARERFRDGGNHSTAPMRHGPLERVTGRLGTVDVDRVKVLAQEYKRKVTAKLVGRNSFLKGHVDFLMSLQLGQKDALTDAQRSRILVLKVIQILSDDYCGMTDEEAEREYIHRLKSNITTKSFQMYLRWNRRFGAQRTMQNHWEFSLEGVDYKIPIKTIATANDKDKRLRLLKKAYFDGMPRAKQLNFSSNVDCVIADSLEKAVKYRLQTVLRNKIRMARFNHHSYKLILSLKFDGAPFNKTGDLRSQTIALLHIANEHFPVTVETLMLCGIINSSEESNETFEMCRHIDMQLSAFQKKISHENPLYIDNMRFNSVEILLTMDLKAANKVLGAGGHSSTFYGITHIGLANGCSGLQNRDKSEKNLFKNYFRDAHDESAIRTWKKGDKPILLNDGLRKLVRKLVDDQMESGMGRRDEHRNRQRSGLRAKEWEKEALKFAKKAGHTFVYKAYFSETNFASICYCALHFKTVKVLDILYLSMIALSSYDRYCGRFEAVGSSLDYFLGQLGTHKAFKSQLSSFAKDANVMWKKLAIKNSICHTGNGLKRLQSYLDAKDKVSFRLIGRQANVILNNMDLFENLLYNSLKKGIYHTENAKIVSNKTRATLKREMEVVFSSIICYLTAIRNVVYWASRSGLDAYPKRPGMITEEDDHFLYEDAVRTCHKELKKATATMDMIQSNLFPDLCRPYDVSITYCLPDTLKQLGDLDICPGYQGLLEQSEKYHTFLTNMPAFKQPIPITKRRCIRKDLDNPQNSEYIESRTQESRNMYKFGRAWLVNCYFYSQPYGLVQETRAKQPDSVADIIPASIFDFFGSRHSCMCGKESRYSACKFCSRGKKTEIWELASETTSLLGTELSSVTRNIFKKWKKLRSMQFTQGLRVQFSL